MKKIINNAIYYFFILMVIVMMWVGLREQFFNNSSFTKIISKVVGEIPFASELYDTVCQVIEVQKELPLQDTQSVLTELFKLLVMAVIQPLVIGLATAIFLPLPQIRNQILLGSQKTYDIQEEYMKSPGYKIKALAIKVLLTPVIAILASNITGRVFKALINTFGNAGLLVSGIISIVIMAGVSLIPLVMMNVPILIAVVWRIVITLFTQIINTLITNWLCIAIVAALASGAGSDLGKLILGLVIWIGIFDFIVKMLGFSITGIGR